ncbi:lipid-A-disaccharide synthase-related protein [Prochlorococcus marinus]|uniref:lipid-A-disaccharide synthase-related protein n=1 Tax=Prochlorococcus marinus TaxID=1219 RepID=UPI00214C7B00|nr:lipid-A-disaccharide synthase-related protein [Prochlorococcus marinus]
MFLCNGHGEDTIACKVIEALHEINPDISPAVLPMVGDGDAFSKLVKDGWLTKIGPSTILPSGGFSNQSFSGLVLDLKAGLLGSLWRQWTLIHRSAKEGRIVVAVGDLLPLLFAWASGANYLFVGTPKSDYTWASGPRSSLSDFYHRLKGTEWDPWEYWLMRSSRCRMVVVRDKITARGLRNHGVKALSPGNPMMDGISKRECPDDFKKYRRLILLCGSRLPEAYQNFKRLLIAIQLIQISSLIAVFVPLSSSSMREKIELILIDLGFKPTYQSSDENGISETWKKNSLLILIGFNKFSCWAKWGEVGVANAGTATEQLVGLGIPCVSLPGKGHQFNFNFAKRQSRLLGGAVTIAKRDETLAKQVGFLLNSDFDREIIGLRGSKRMGPEGGSHAIALIISTHLSKGLECGVI